MYLSKNIKLYLYQENPFFSLLLGKFIIFRYLGEHFLVFMLFKFYNTIIAHDNKILRKNSLFGFSLLMRTKSLLRKLKHDENYVNNIEFILNLNCS